MAKDKLLRQIALLHESKNNIILAIKMYYNFLEKCIQWPPNEVDIRLYITALDFKWAGKDWMSLADPGEAGAALQTPQCLIH